MERDEVELFLKARRDERRIRVIAGVCVVVAALAPLLLNFRETQFLFRVIFPVAVLGSFAFGFDLLLPQVGAVSRRELLDLIETQINRDPGALMYLKSRR